MSKAVSSALMDDIQRTVTTLVTCVEIQRKDGQTIRLTTHDKNITFNDNVYRHDIPFSLSAIQSGSSLSVDNTDLTLFADDENILLSDVKNGLYEYAAVRIFQINHEDTSHGAVIMRQGWFGPTKPSENRIVTFTITGLLKILDLEIGRVYQPSCDADLGDKRCKVAIDQSQIYSIYNPYNLGDWVYRYDPALMEAITVVNPSFEADGARNSAQSITGWTKSPGAKFAVAAGGGSLGTFGPVDGTYMLVGDVADEVGKEHILNQIIDLDSASTVDLADIDDGKITIAFFANLLQGFYTLDPVRIKVEMLSAADIVLDTLDTRYQTFDTFDDWRERGLVGPLSPNARKLRLSIYFLVGEGLQTNCAADNIRLYWWDHTLGNPYSDNVYQLTRLTSFLNDALFYPTNPSFEANTFVSNANSPVISGWTTGAGNWWQVTNSFSPLTSLDGVYFLVGGDDGGAVQKTYEIKQTKHLVTDFKLDAARILLGKYVGQFFVKVGWADADSAATVTINFLNEANSIVGTQTPLSADTGTGWGQLTEDFVIPGAATKVQVVLQATSPIGSGNAKVAFDDVRFKIYDAERPKKSDPVEAFGGEGTAFNTLAGSYTIDNQIVWRAVGAFVGYDEVGALINNRNNFVGTTISGSPGTYETAPIRWLSGANAGLRNIVRKWSTDTQALKTYFRTPYPIQVGDRFMYTRACARRFEDDCLLIFNNAINFRGFPYLPGKLTKE